jgi:nucleoside-diphosphate-sugar epimerase
MRTCFVTGAGGFIGSRLVEELLERGCHVRALVRDPARPRWLPAGRVEVVAGDMDNDAALARGARGADVVYHLAALTRARDPADLHLVNVEGTRRLVAACAAQTTPPRVVLVSSQAAGGPARDGHPVDETTTPRPVSAYGASKLAAERVLEARARDLPAAIVRPPSVYGPRDVAFLPLFRMARRGVLLLPGGLGALAIVHVDDLARGLALAGESGTGTYYLTDGARHDARGVGSAIIAATESKARVAEIPAPLFMATVWAVERCAHALGKRAPLTLDRAKDATARHWACSDARARRELGYASRHELAAAMRDTAAWYRSQGWL